MIVVILLVMYVSWGLVTMEHVFVMKDGVELLAKCVSVQMIVQIMAVVFQGNANVILIIWAKTAVYHAAQVIAKAMAHV